MKTLNIDPNLFAQIGLDSGSLTMLGVVVNNFNDPGEYRGTVQKHGENKGVFYISVDKEIPIAQANIDLATLTGHTLHQGSEACKCNTDKNRFYVNPRGYVVFHVSGGSGGYSVNVRKAEKAKDTKIFDSRKLEEGATFAATILRPGSYSIVNEMDRRKAEVVIPYPRRGKKPFRPPEPMRIKTTEKGFSHDHIKLEPTQGLIFEIETSARIKIDLVEPDDGPKEKQKA